MQVGDLVKIWKVSRWGGRLDTGRVGVVVRRKRLSYDAEYCTWEVLEGDTTTVHEQKRLSVVTS